MKNNIQSVIFVLISMTVSFLTVSSCDLISTSETSGLEQDPNRVPSQKTKDYWYDGTAEISSYTLTQARYGELHEGTATLVYVTEPFSRESNTKADQHRKSNVPVLKLNTTKKFTTGIYPYSIMTSTFLPFEGSNTSLKIASSMQEWCGMTYLEMKNDKKLSFSLNSYFEGRSFENQRVSPSLLEDDLWSLIRLNPESLPTGKLDIIPSMEQTLLINSPITSTEATATLSENQSDIRSYIISYPAMDRTLTIHFEDEFPHKITGWEETRTSGYGSNRKTLTTKAVIKKTVKTPYWQNNTNQDKHWRDTLGL